MTLKYFQCQQLQNTKNNETTERFRLSISSMGLTDNEKIDIV